LWLRFPRTLQNTVVDVRVVPHEGSFEIIMVAVPVHSLQRRQSEQNPGQRVQEVVVDVKLLQCGAEGDRERNRLVLEFVVRQEKSLQFGKTPNVRRQGLKEVVSEGKGANIHTPEDFGWNLRDLSIAEDAVKV